MYKDLFENVRLCKIWGRKDTQSSFLSLSHSESRNKRKTKTNDGREREIKLHTYIKDAPDAHLLIDQKSERYLLSLIVVEKKQREKFVCLKRWRGQAPNHCFHSLTFLQYRMSPQLFHSQLLLPLSVFHIFLMKEIEYKEKDKYRREKMFIENDSSTSELS